MQSPPMDFTYFSSDPIFSMQYMQWIDDFDTGATVQYSTDNGTTWHVIAVQFAIHLTLG